MNALEGDEPVTVAATEETEVVREEEREAREVEREEDTVFMAVAREKVAVLREDDSATDEEENDDPSEVEKELKRLSGTAWVAEAERDDTREEEADTARVAVAMEARWN